MNRRTPPPHPVPTSLTRVETRPLPRRAAERMYAPGRSIGRLPSLRVACLLVDPPVHGKPPVLFLTCSRDVDLLTARADRGLSARSGASRRRRLRVRSRAADSTRCGPQARAPEGQVHGKLSRVSHSCPLSIEPGNAPPHRIRGERFVGRNLRRKLRRKLNQTGSNKLGRRRSLRRRFGAGSWEAARSFQTCSPDMNLIDSIR